MGRSSPTAPRGPVALFCERLRRLQKASGVKQTSLAKKAGLSTTQMSDILNGHIKTAPAWEIVEAIVRACLTQAETAGRDVPPDLRGSEDLKGWRRRHQDLEQDLDAISQPGTKDRRRPPCRPSMPSRAGWSTTGRTW